MLIQVSTIYCDPFVLTEQPAYTMEAEFVAKLPADGESHQQFVSIQNNYSNNSIEFYGMKKHFAIKQFPQFPGRLEQLTVDVIHY